MNCFTISYLNRSEAIIRRKNYLCMFNDEKNQKITQINSSLKVREIIGYHNRFVRKCYSNKIINEKNFDVYFLFFL